MGKFKFIGPHYTFQNKKDTTCRCSGFTGLISEKIENYLFTKQTHILDLTELPDDDLVDKIQNIHLGKDLRYDISSSVTQYQQDTKYQRLLAKTGTVKNEDVKYMHDHLLEQYLEDKDNEIFETQEKDMYEEENLLKVDERKPNVKKLVSVIKHPWSR